MIAISSYVFERYSKPTVFDWAQRLFWFRFVRSAGGFADYDPDKLMARVAYSTPSELLEIIRILGASVRKFESAPPAPQPGVSYCAAEWAQFPCIIPGTQWWEQPSSLPVGDGHISIRCDHSSVKLEISEDYTITEKVLRIAESIENVLAGCSCRFIDPPVDNNLCVCPKYYPEIIFKRG